MLGFSKAFSPYLAETAGVSSAVVRKDFSIFGISGKKRGGYDIDELLAQIDNVLGKNEMLNVALAGAGNLGRALMHYRNFERQGIRIAAEFDSGSSRYGESGNPPVLPVERMEEYIRVNLVRIGIIAVPDMAAQEVADKMTRGGITGILNFAPIQVRVPPECTVRNVNLAFEIDALAYFAASGRPRGSHGAGKGKPAVPATGATS